MADSVPATRERAARPQRSIRLLGGRGPSLGRGGPRLGRPGALTGCPGDLLRRGDVGPQAGDLVRQRRQDRPTHGDRGRVEPALQIAAGGCGEPRQALWVAAGI